MAACGARTLVEVIADGREIHGRLNGVLICRVLRRAGMGTNEGQQKQRSTSAMRETADGQGAASVVRSGGAATSADAGRQDSTAGSAPASNQRAERSNSDGPFLGSSPAPADEGSGGCVSPLRASRARPHCPQHPQTSHAVRQGAEAPTKAIVSLLGRSLSSGGSGFFGRGAPGLCGVPSLPYMAPPLHASNAPGTSNAQEKGWVGGTRGPQRRAVSSVARRQLDR